MRLTSLTTVPKDRTETCEGWGCWVAEPGGWREGLTTGTVENQQPESSQVQWTDCATTGWHKKAQLSQALISDTIRHSHNGDCESCAEIGFIDQDGEKSCYLIPSQLGTPDDWLQSLKRVSFGRSGYTAGTASAPLICREGIGAVPSSWQSDCHVHSIAYASRACTVCNRVKDSTTCWALCDIYWSYCCDGPSQHTKPQWKAWMLVDKGLWIGYKGVESPVLARAGQTQMWRRAPFPAICIHMSQRWE